MVQILVAVGSNLTDAAGREPLSVCLWAVERLGRSYAVRAVSRWYRSLPVPASDQPDYVNGAVSLEGSAPPETVLAELHAIEAEAGRARSVPNAARELDLDLLGMGQEVRSGAELLLPHPRLQERLFVLAPLCDVAPGWRHPLLGRTAAELLAELRSRTSPDLLSTVRAIT